MTLLALLSSLSTAWASCEEPTTNQAIDLALSNALQAYADLDVEGMGQHVEQARGAVPCLAEPLDPAVAARLHRTTGIVAFSARDTDLAERSFAAARVLEPSFRFPSTLVPEGNPILVHYNALDLSGVDVLDVGAPAAGTVYLDGRTQLKRRDGLPLVYQFQNPDGSLHQSALLVPGAQLPTYPSFGPPPKVPSSRRKTFLRIALASGAVSVASFGAALGVNEGFRGEHPKGRRNVVNALSILNVGTGVTAAGFGVAGLLQPRE